MKKALFAFLISALGLTATSSHAMDNMAMPQGKTMPSKDITGKGVVVSADKASGTVMLKHEPISAIGWPAMTMNFKVQDKLMLGQVRKGDQVTFTLKPEGKDYVVTRLK